MDFTDDTSTGHEADDDDHERRLRQASDQGGHNIGETWPLSAGQAAGNAAIARSPHVSLFSPGVPAMSPPASSDAGVGYARATHEGSPTPAGPSRPLSSLAAVASMTKRTSRLKLGDDHTPIVQLQTQIPSVQKSGDDPTTPLDTPGKKRTTIDLVGNEYATINSLSGLFAGGTSMSHSRAPSYNQATGPLYLRGTSACGYCCEDVLDADPAQHPTTLFPCPTTSSHAVCLKAVTQTSASLHLAGATTCTAYCSTELPSSPLPSQNPGLRVSPRR